MSERALGISKEHRHHRRGVGAFVRAYLAEALSRGLQAIVGTAAFEIVPLLYFRLLVIRLLFAAGRSILVGSGFMAVRPHFFEGGHLSLGDHVKISRNVEIDYSGGVTVEDGVWISQNVIIETHQHVIARGPKSGWSIIRSRLVVGADSWIGANAVILSSVKSIGSGAIVGAGAVVVDDVPAMAIAAGVPARIVGQRPRA